MRAIRPGRYRVVRYKKQTYESRIRYDLQIDRQVERFQDLKHKLVFFLITAAVGTLGYTLNFAITQLSKVTGDRLAVFCMVAGAVLGLLSAGFSLYSLNQEIVSYHLHLDIRYKRISVEDLPKERQEYWDRVKWRASFSQGAAFVLLFLSVAFQAALFISIVI